MYDVERYSEVLTIKSNPTVLLSQDARYGKTGKRKTCKIFMTKPEEDR